MKWIICGSAFLLVIGCGFPPADEGAEATRGVVVAKADFAPSGSCVSACGDQALNGECWCDDRCADYGDCCTDRAAACELGPSSIDGEWTYSSLPGEAKQAYLWDQKVLPSEYDALPSMNLTGWDILGSVGSFLSLKKTFTHVSDEMPQGRVKFIHPFGVVAAVHFVAAADSPYTGLYSTGAYGLARLSLAGSPSALAYTPGMALKLFVDSGPSQNLVVMFSLNGQGADHNFFANDFSNKIPEPTGLTLRFLKWIFSQASSRPLEMRLDHFANVDRYGGQVAHSNAPGQLFFVPAEGIRKLIESDTDEDFRASLGDTERFPPGTRLYDIYDENDRFIGAVLTASRFAASQWGDQKLFFQHPPREDD